MTAELRKALAASPRWAALAGQAAAAAAAAAGAAGAGVARAAAAAPTAAARAGPEADVQVAVYGAFSGSVPLPEQELELLERLEQATGEGVPPALAGKGAAAGVKEEEEAALGGGAAPEKQKQSQIKMSSRSTSAWDMALAHLEEPPAAATAAGSAVAVKQEEEEEKEQQQRPAKRARGVSRSSSSDASSRAALNKAIWGSTASLLAAGTGDEEGTAGELPGSSLVDDDMAEDGEEEEAGAGAARGGSKARGGEASRRAAPVRRGSSSLSQRQAASGEQGGGRLGRRVGSSQALSAAAEGSSGGSEATLAQSSKGKGGSSSKDESGSEQGRSRKRNARGRGNGSESAGSESDASQGKGSDSDVSMESSEEFSESMSGSESGSGSESSEVSESGSESEQDEDLFEGWRRKRKREAQDGSEGGAAAGRGRPQRHGGTAKPEDREDNEDLHDSAGAGKREAEPCSMVQVSERELNGGRRADPRAARILVVCNKFETGGRAGGCKGPSLAVPCSGMILFVKLWAAAKAFTAWIADTCMDVPSRRPCLLSHLPLSTTGYDDPRLGALFIDRPLASAARAVQVLGRLNRWVRNRDGLPKMTKNVSVAWPRILAWPACVYTIPGWGHRALPPACLHMHGTAHPPSLIPAHHIPRNTGPRPAPQLNKSAALVRVVDFANTASELRAAFEQFWGATTLCTGGRSFIFEEFN